MSRFLSGFARAIGGIVDPKRQERIEAGAAALERALRTQGDTFDLGAAAQAAGLADEEIADAAEIAYTRAARLAWRDRTISAGERQALAVIASRLGVKPKTATDIQRTIGKEHLLSLLDDCIRKNDANDADLAIATAIGEGLGGGLEQLAAAECRGRTRELVSRMFDQFASQRSADEGAYRHLEKVARALGVRGADFENIVGERAGRMAEHALSEARADGVISDEERRELTWILDRLPLDARLRSYVREEIGEMDALAALGRGYLPTIRVEGVELRAGELAALDEAAQHRRFKRTRTSEGWVTTPGRVIVTDSRLLFLSHDQAVRPWALPHSSVISLKESRGGITVEATGKGGGVYEFLRRPRFAAAVYRTAIGRANQSIIAEVQGNPSRHIPRDVRQRVWQTYGGACAECKARDYLEFDHIVPVARGGSNDEKNVQLLCRRCNGKKGDRI